MGTQGKVDQLRKDSEIQHKPSPNFRNVWVYLKKKKKKFQVLKRYHSLSSAEE